MTEKRNVQNKWTFKCHLEGWSQPKKSCQYLNKSSSIKEEMSKLELRHEEWNKIKESLFCFCNINLYIKAKILRINLLSIILPNMFINVKWENEWDICRFHEK
jgi:hypothetical protein